MIIDKACLNIICFSVLISVGIQGFGQAWNLEFGPQLMKTTDQGVYKTDIAGGIKISFGVKPLKWISVYGGFGWNKFHIIDERLQYQNLQSWDWNLRFKPVERWKTSIFIGSFRHNYYIKARQLNLQGYVFLPPIRWKDEMNGWLVGLNYEIYDWLLLSCSYEQESIYFEYRPKHRNYITINASYTFGFGKKYLLQMIQ